MPSEQSFNNGDDQVSELIDKLYDELCSLRFEYMTARRKKNLDEDKIKSLLSEIELVNEDYQSLAKSHTIYLRFKKSSGKNNPTHSAGMLERLKSITTNVGKINGMLPGK